MMMKKGIKMRRILGEWYESGCPSCGWRIDFSESDGITINCETKGQYPIKRMLQLTRTCKNPLCKWSKVKLHDAE